MPDRALYLVRHGHHHDDPTDPYDDGPLSELGERQTRYLGKRLRGKDFSVLHHSTMRRAARTAEILSEYLPSAPVRPTDLVREFTPNRPANADLTRAQIDFFDAHPQHQLDEEPVRAAEAIAEFTSLTSDGRPELVVAHGNVCRWFVQQALGGRTRCG